MLRCVLKICVSLRSSMQLTCLRVHNAAPDMSEDILALYEGINCDADTTSNVSGCMLYTRIAVTAT